jgi:hypothetical protein
MPATRAGMTNGRAWLPNPVRARRRFLVYRAAMERTVLRQLLAQAEWQAVQHQHQVARQEQLIAELDQQGHDTAEARDVLATLTATQRRHELYVERLLKQLAE